MSDCESHGCGECHIDGPTGTPNGEDVGVSCLEQLEPPPPACGVALGMINAEIAASEERMRQAIDATDLAIWDYDLDSGSVHLTDSWSWLLGGPRKPTDTSIQELTELVPQPDRDTVRAEIIKAVKGEGAAEYRATHRVTKPGGGFIWVLSEGRVVQRAPDGRALRMIGVNRDITERKLLEDQLALRDARYRAVIDASMDGFWMVDMEERLLEVNDAYVRQSGYSRDELVRMRVSDLEAKEHQREVAVHHVKVKWTGHDRFESEHRRKDGSIWPVEVEATYCPDLNVSFVFVMDISERRRAERQMAAQRAELEALQRTQIAAHTAAAFAHELNQPLGAISSYSEAALIMLDVERPPIERLRETIEKSRNQALRAGDAIRELLALLGTGLVVTDAIDLNGAIRDVLNIARSDAELRFRSKLKLEWGLGAVRANRIHLTKVLLNLLNNAVDAMRDANVPEPLIVVAVCTRRGEGLAQVTVQDNGPGISGDWAGHLFEPFFSTKQKGVGMGLAISRSLIEANGGQLWCDPEEGPGAVFHLTLPFVEEAAP